MLNRYLSGEDEPKDIIILTKIDNPPMLKAPRPKRSTLIHRIPGTKKYSLETIVEFDFLKLFRHDLLSTNKPASSLIQSYNMDNRLQLISIINHYFDYLDELFQKKPDARYLDLINYKTYPYDDWLAYGCRFTQCINEDTRYFPPTKKIVFARVLQFYNQIHPKGILYIREKLCELLTKSLDTGLGNAHDPEISYEMITYPIVDECQLFQKISLIPTVDRQLDYLIKFISMPSSTRNSFNRIFAAINTAIQSSPLSVFRPKLHIYGSIASDLANFDSDLNLILKLEAPTKDAEAFDFETSMLALEAIDRVLSEKLNMSSLDAGKRFIPARRCPVLKYDFSVVFSHLAPNTRETSRLYSSAKISVKSNHGVFSSKMILFLTQCDPRFKKLTIILKHWAKRRGLIKANGLRSYEFTLLVVFFLQTRKPVVLPNIDRLKKVAANLMKENNHEPWDFSEYFEVVDLNRNSQSLGSLLVEFFQYYATFNYQYAICPRLGQMVAKQVLLASKTEAESVGFNNNSIIWIEDPLAVENNVSSSWSEATCTKFINEMRKMDRSGIDESNIIRKLYSNFLPSPSFSAEKPSSFSYNTDIKNASTSSELPSTSFGSKKTAANGPEYLANLAKRKLIFCSGPEDDSEIEFLGVFKGTRQPKKKLRIKMESNE